MERRAANLRAGLGLAALAMLGACASTRGTAGESEHGSGSAADARSVVIVRGDGGEKNQRGKQGGAVTVVHFSASTMVVRLCLIMPS